MPSLMFVDDDVSILSALRRSLHAHRAQWDMRFVSSAAEAIELMQREPADVVIADVRMPGMDGGQLLTIICERWPDTARLMLSGDTEAEDLLHVVSVAQRFLDKPCDRSVLVHAIESALLTKATLGGAVIRGDIGGLSLLPSAAATLEELQRVLDRDDATPRDVATVVQRDIGLTVKVVQLANSALFGGAGDVASVDAALDRLGVQTVRSVAGMHGLADPVGASGPIDADWLDRLNTHATLTARLAVDLVPSEDAKAAMCVAMLGECGQLVLAACRPAEFGRLLGERHNADPTASEQATFGLTHARAGAHLLELWGFPSDVVDAVATHDQPPASAGPRPGSIADAVRIARIQAAEHTRSVCGSDFGDLAGVNAVHEEGIQ